jgi:hypothetical protein
MLPSPTRRVTEVLCIQVRLAWTDLTSGPGASSEEAILLTQTCSGAAATVLALFNLPAARGLAQKFAVHPEQVGSPRLGPLVTGPHGFIPTKRSSRWVALISALSFTPWCVFVLTISPYPLPAYDFRYDRPVLIALVERSCRGIQAPLWPTASEGARRYSTAACSKFSDALNARRR